MKGELADESLGAFHGDTNGRSFGTLIPFNAKHFCYRRRHNDLISTGVYESQELALPRQAGPGHVSSGGRMGFPVRGCC
jgi:hypothetical protein